MQFFIDPTAFNEILELFQIFGQQAINHVFYLIRTYNYYLYRQMQILLGHWPGDQVKAKKYKKHDRRNKKPTVKNDLYSSTNFPIIAGHPVRITDLNQAFGHDTPHQLTDYLRTVSSSPPAVATLTPAEPVVSALSTLHPASQHMSLSSDQPHDRPSDQMCDGSSYGVVGYSDHSSDYPATRLQSKQIGFSWIHDFVIVLGCVSQEQSNLLDNPPLSSHFFIFDIDM